MLVAALQVVMVALELLAVLVEVGQVQKVAAPLEVMGL
jgi:hypothetical protein